MEEVGPLSKRCRLCAVERGPFLNIFGADAQLASKIRQLLPIVVDEWDDLPHKSCFRCSAKIVELHEFTEKCMETQKIFLTKLKINSKRNISLSHRNKNAREAWEAKLKKKNISNDEYCDRLVQKALASFSCSEKNLDKNDDRLKELKVVVRRVDQTGVDKQSKTDLNKQDDRKKNSVTCVPGEILDNISYIDVSGVDSIYSCKVCSRIFTQKEKINSHICKGKLPESGTETHASRQCSDSFAGYAHNFRNSVPNSVQPNVPSMNGSGVSITTSTQMQCLVKTQDNKFFILPSLDGTNVSKSPVVLVSDCSSLQNSLLNTINNKSNLQSDTNNLMCNINRDPFASLKERDKQEDDANNVVLKNSKEKTTKTTEPYPVSLLYSGNKEIHNAAALNFENRRTKKNKKSSSKKYKVMLNKKPGKIIITSVDKKSEEKDEPSSLIDKKKKSSQNSDVREQCDMHFPRSKLLSVIQSKQEDRQFFTIHNIDPTPSDYSSYVLPTTNIVQESLISTTVTPVNHQKSRKRKKDKVVPQSHEVLPVSTAKCRICELQCDKNMLNVHIQSHFLDENTMDTNDAIKSTKERKRRRRA